MRSFCQFAPSWTVTLFEASSPTVTSLPVNPKMFAGTEIVPKVMLFSAAESTSSVSLPSTLKGVTGESSVMLPVSAVTAGASLLPVTVRVRVEDEGAPWLSFMV